MVQEEEAVKPGQATAKRWTSQRLTQSLTLPLNRLDTQQHLILSACKPMLPRCPSAVCCGVKHGPGSVVITCALPVYICDRRNP